MLKKPEIMVVCGFGIGTSLILKITLDKVLIAEGIEAKTFCADEATARGHQYDIVFTSNDMLRLFRGVEKPVVVIKNFLNEDEIREKGLEIIQSYTNN